MLNTNHSDLKEITSPLAEDFLLNNHIAKTLYNQVACKLPIIDYHNHLSPEMMLENRRFKNITELWIRDDQYKHRLMRINGVSENFITGNGTDEEKFLAWMRTYPKTLGNPLYHWSQLEIKDIFGPGIDLLNDDPLKIWDECNALLGVEGFSVIEILNKWNSEILCTSDDLLDPLEAHRTISNRESKITVLPSLRSDSILAFGTEGYLQWLKKLEELTNIKITDLKTFQEAVKKRLDYFQEAGCSLSDHGLDSGFLFSNTTDKVAEEIFLSVLSNVTLTREEILALKSNTLSFLGVEYGKRKLTMQLHLGAQRSTSSRLKNIASKFGGFATLGDPLNIESLCGFLDSLETAGHLPRTILYTLNPTDNERMATLTGSFAEDGVRGKIQFGPAWWFNDHYDGIKKQIIAISSYGLLSSFIGMTSDSRSFLSLSRHYYFRRILCHLIGDWVDKGILPADFEVLATLVTDVCYTNAKNLVTKGQI
ncbi:glucuronate isomerase [Pedobacter psychrodurus]|uniref:Uronate isomerase n=1 Tax=Pedobacter psychrodurus TaxID=2530456 RepID=A0A4R0PYY5_9SPHI|nr:glucuronate isomerase [Pedobacter psychrodurus]TCD28350.1 glucuronate isomerase [Pedobacter psychrodurus]